MKKVMSKNKAIIIALMAIISTSLFNPASAIGTKDGTPGVEVKYLGYQRQNPVFEIVLNNSRDDQFIIKVRDEAGSVLHSEKISGKNLSRTYRIDTEEEIAEGSLRFEITSVNNKKTEIYLVGITESSSREMVVNKIQ